MASLGSERDECRVGCDFSVEYPGGLPISSTRSRNVLDLRDGASEIRLRRCASMCG